MIKHTILDIGSFYTKIKASWNSEILIVPTMVAKDFQRNKMYFGDEALSIWGKENQEIKTIFPIQGGKIKDKESLIDILAYLLEKIGYDKNKKESICVLTPPSLPQYDYILLKETLRETRWMSKDIYTFPQPLSDLLSFNPSLHKQPIELIINIGHYQTTITAISYGEIVRSVQLRKGLEALFYYIQSQILEEYQLEVSLIDIHRSLIELRSLNFTKIDHLPFYGINLTSELPMRMNIEATVFENAIQRYFTDIQKGCYQLLKRLPKEMYDIILIRGACLTGGICQFKHSSRLLEEVLGFDVQAHPLGQQASLIGFEHAREQIPSQLKPIDDRIFNVSR